MKIWFWSIIVLMTVAAWSCLILPCYKSATLKIGYLAKVIIITFPLLVLAAYWFFGGSNQLEQFWNWQHQETQVQQEMVKLKSPQELIDRLRDHLQQAPQSTEGWYLLGKLYLDQQQYADAETALNKAYQLQPNAGEIVVTLAKAEFLQSSRTPHARYSNQTECHARIIASPGGCSKFISSQCLPAAKLSFSSRLLATRFGLSSGRQP